MPPTTSARARSRHPLGGGAVVGAILAVALLLAGRPARAQCGADASSCLTCHESYRNRPVLSDATPWHRDHGFGDLCAGCHGGDVRATTKIAAHAPRVDPLAAPLRSCTGTGVACHADPAPLAARYAANRDHMGGAAPPPPPPAPRPPSRWPDLAFGLAALALATGGLGYVRANERRRRDRPSPARTGAPPAPSEGSTRSVYLAGIGLGVVVAISTAIFGRPVGASGAFQNVAGSIALLVAPEARYWLAVMPSGITWQVKVIVGVFVGALAGAALRGQWALRWIPEREWSRAFGPGRARRWLLAFLGAALIEYASAIAGGCTSGLAISGGVVLAPAAFLFMAAMFAGGIPTAWLLYLHVGRDGGGDAGRPDAPSSKGGA